jgi:hypothetical protein
MDFQIYLLYGFNYYFSIWLGSSTLTVKPDRIVISSAVKTLYLDKERVTKLSGYTLPIWSFQIAMRAFDYLRIEHSDPNYQKFIVIRAFNLNDVKNDLINNGYSLE